MLPVVVPDCSVMTPCILLSRILVSGSWLTPKATATANSADQAIESDEQGDLPLGDAGEALTAGHEGEVREHEGRQEDGDGQGGESRAAQAPAKELAP